MTELTDSLRVGRAADAACTAVVKHPEDALARESLLSALKSLAATLIEEVGPQTDQFGESLTEIQVWADIVRTRIIAITPTRKSIHALQAVRHPARDPSDAQALGGRARATATVGCCMGSLTPIWRSWRMGVLNRLREGTS
jgi:hypothetical protein